MQYIPVIFGRNHKVGSLLIRLVCRSRWSHVGIVINGTHVLESIAFKGVVITPIEEFKKRYSSIEEAEMPAINKKLAILKAMTEVGKNYDYYALLGILLRTKWGSANKWFCSELVAHCSGLYKQARIGRTHLEHIWMVCK